MTIKELKKAAVGQKIGGGFPLVVKTTHKATPRIPGVKNKGWVHRVTLTDGTGDMLADVNIDAYKPLQRKMQIKCIVCEIRDNYTRKGDKLLYVDQYEVATQTVDEMLDEETEWAIYREKVVHSKIKCLIVAHKSVVLDLDELEVYSKDPRLDRVVDNIMKG